MGIGIGMALRAAPRRQLAVWDARVWIGVLVGALLAGMLAGFHQVVSGAVQQAELRHKANALMIEATWRCNSALPPASPACSTLVKARASSTDRQGKNVVLASVFIE